MPTARIRTACLAFCGLALGLGLPAGQEVPPAQAADSTTCKYFSQLPDDCAGAEQRKYVDLRGYRYEQIDLFAKDALKKVPYVSTYNTTGLNGGDDFARFGAEVACHRPGSEEDRETVPGARRGAEPCPLLDDRLARRSHRRRAQLRRARRGLDGKQPGGCEQSLSQADL